MATNQEYIIQGSTLNNIADAVRDKTGTTERYTPSAMPAAIRSISGDPIYTELYRKNYKLKQRPFGYKDATRNLICIRCCNLTPGKLYQVQIFSRSHFTNNATRWIHPANDKNSHSKYPAIGYYQIAGKTMNISSVDIYTYPPVPSWMPNNGVLQTEWDFVADSSGEYTLELNLSQLFLPLLKPDKYSGSSGSYEFRWSDVDGYMWLIGDRYTKRLGAFPKMIERALVNSISSEALVESIGIVGIKTPFRSFQFRLKDVDTGYTSPICDTLKVSKPRGNGQGSLKFDYIYIS